MKQGELSSSRYVEYVFIAWMTFNIKQFYDVLIRGKLLCQIA
jgi:hypothetical protein